MPTMAEAAMVAVTARILKARMRVSSHRGSSGTEELYQIEVTRRQLFRTKIGKHRHLETLRGLDRSDLSDKSA